MKLLFLYFSGTGNTDYVTRYLVRKLSDTSVELEMRSIERQPADQVSDFDLLAVGFPVYACDSPGFFQSYLGQLPPGGGRGALAYCTKGAFAGGAVRRNLQRLGARGYVPLAGGSVTMPGTDGLALLPKNSRMARMALEKDYDHLEDADRLAGRWAEVVSDLRAGHSVEALSQRLPSSSRVPMPDRIWAFLYEVAENYARSRFRADEQCVGCGLCVELCPVDNVELLNGRSAFGDQCALCMRCVHACPQEAIQIGKITLNKFRWRGPKGDFEPLRLRSGDGDPPVPL
jgi:ferredoxin